MRAKLSLMVGLFVLTAGCAGQSPNSEYADNASRCVSTIADPTARQLCLMRADAYRQREINANVRAWNVGMGSMADSLGSEANNIGNNVNFENQLRSSSPVPSFQPPTAEVPLTTWGSSPKPAPYPNSLWNP